MLLLADIGLAQAKLARLTEIHLTTVGLAMADCRLARTGQAGLTEIRPHWLAAVGLAGHGLARTGLAALTGI